MDIMISVIQTTVPAINTMIISSKRHYLIITSLQEVYHLAIEKETIIGYKTGLLMIFNNHYLKK